MNCALDGKASHRQGKGKAVKINVKQSEHSLEAIRQALWHEFYLSRFAVTFETIDRNKINVSNVRLMEKKDYCGSHPGTCQIQRAHRKGAWLEGADWVEFNDRLNNVLDGFGVSANVASSVVVLRKGRERCIEYYGQPSRGPNAEWAKYGRYADYCGKVAPASRFPLGTPGIYERIAYNVEG
jgi:hypothetical protein